MEKITMSPEIFSGYTNPYPKNMKKVLWTENINGQESFVKSWIEYHKGKQDNCFTLFRPCDILYKIQQLSRISDDRRLSGVLYTENTDCALAGYCRCAVFFSDAVEERNRYMGIARKKRRKH